MGVPKFTRFICERYPCLLEVLNDYQIPEFDNLYLDMNGIIHCCSHPNDADAHFRITEETIFKNIFLYVEILFRTIKPQKLFFMAVDGVAPRAKINQQRSRRFKSAKEAEIVEARARAKGEILPEEARFDSNCITPGTEFMAKLTEQLRYFVIYKISTDKLWQKCKIILSGPEVPGEGEHKIMDYIRYMKSQPSHDPNTRHCLYGLDADLVMLSLCTHEPHFAVLREEVKYGRNTQKSTTLPEKTKFCLLHVSLLREYMEHEFESIKPLLPFPFDIEKIIDDWILMGFLIGNDFIPHLPNLHIANGALPILYQAYMEILPTLDGYINESGTLNLPRFEKFMEKLSTLDVKHFSEHQADLKYFESKMARHPQNNVISYNNQKSDSPVNVPVKKSFKKDLESLIQSTEDMLVGHSDEEDDLLDTEDSDNETYTLEFIQHKQDYYIKKFDYEKVDADVMRQQAEAYVTAIQWNLHYYYDGCCSWSWYYPHHYAPFISDIKDFKHLKFNFDLAKPFLPFQQLLAVLPAASRGLLPEAYQGLLTEEESPIIDYYPDDFKTDLNEKKQEWEAVVLIPFIDEKNLIDAMEPYNAKLTPDEQKRNSHGPMSVITYTEENLGVITAPAYFPTIESHAKIVLVDPKDIDVPREKLNKGLMKGVKLSVYFPGFPTLQYLKHDVKLEKCKVKVFEQPSRNENMMITILPKEAPGIHQLASDLLGKIVFIKWPHLLEAHVVGVSDGSRKFSLIDPDKPYSLDNINREELKGQGEVQWRAEARDVSMGYKTRFGIIVGDIEALVHVRPITGRRYILTAQGRMSLQKEWSNIPCYYPYHSIVRDIEVEETGNIAHKSISEIYTPKSICFMLGHPHYGAMGEVVEPGVNHKTGRVKVAMNISPEPELSLLKREQQQMKMQYMHGSIAAQRLGISSHLLSRITGSIFVSPNSVENSDKKQHNVGLNLKFNKRNEELPGYTKKSNGQWTYSSKSVGLIRNYMEQYPKLFEKLVENVGNDIFNEDDLFTSDGEDVMDVVKWLKEQPFKSVESRNCDYEGLDPDIIAQLQTEVDDFVEKNSNNVKTVIMQVKPHLLFKPGINNGNIPPDTKAKHKVFDRIISVKENSSVPIGYKGTIINIQEFNGEIDNVYDILFDKSFIGGISFNGGANCRRSKLHSAEFINISHGIRTEQDITGIGHFPDKVVKKNKNKEVSAQSNSAFASFNAHGNFFPTFGKDKGQGNHNQGQSQTQIRVMKKGREQGQGMKSAPVRGSESRKGEKREQAGRKVDVTPSVVTKGTVSEPEVRKVEANTEFQMLWNELQKIPITANNPKPMIPPFPQMRPPPIAQAPMASCVPDAPQDPSAFLKAVLKIPDDKATSEQSKSSTTNRVPFTFPPTPPAPPSNVPTSNAPTLVQQMFDHARQARKDNISYCARLLNHFQLMGIGMPRYFYNTQKNLVSAQIVLPDMRKFYGDLCSNHELAAESVAKNVYNELNLDNAPKPRPYFDLLPPNAWLNIQPPMNVPPPVMMSPRSFPDAQKPPVRPPANWNTPRMLQQSPGFTQIPPPRMNHPITPLMTPGTSQTDNKPEIKLTAPFVPLQAQKKTRSRHPKDKSHEIHNFNKEQEKVKTQKAKPKENSPKIPRDEKSTKENEGKSSKDNPTVMQKSHKNPRQRRSRIAANFGSSSAANGSEK